MSAGVYKQGTFGREPAAPIKTERFGAQDGPDARAEQMTRMQASVTAVTESQRRDRGQGKLVFEDLTTGTLGSPLVIQHNLGRKARWRVVDWYRTSPGGGFNLERSRASSDTNDENTLTLLSYTAGVVTIEVE